jgi:hypothetical protein
MAQESNVAAIVGALLEAAYGNGATHVSVHVGPQE